MKVTFNVFDMDADGVMLRAEFMACAISFISSALADVKAVAEGV